MFATNAPGQRTDWNPTPALVTHCSENRMSQLRIDLQALLYRENGWWIAHCLEMDIAAECKTAKEAVTSLVSLCDFQIEESLQEGDLSSAFKPAPKELWLMFSLASDAPDSIASPLGNRLRRRKGAPLNRFAVREMVLG